MRSKHKKQFDPAEHEAEVLTWESVKMKALLDYRTPYRPFIDVVKSIEQLDDGVCRVIGHEKMNSRTCLCGKNPHTDDCLIHPHLILKLLDPDENKRIIPSLWLEPVTFKSKSDEVQPISLDHADAAELPNQDVVKAEEQGVPIVEIKKDCDEKKYVLVEILSSGKFKVTNIESLDDPNFIFDAESLEWISNDFCGKVGESIPLDGKDWINGFVVVLEGQEHDVFELVFSFATILKNSIKSMLTKEINKI